MFILFTRIIGFVLQILIPVFAPAFEGFVPFVYLCGFGIPEAALTVRRFHDTGNNGWFAALFGASWFFGIIATLSAPSDEALTYCALQIGLQIIVFILVRFDSQPEPNKYGPNPKWQ
jgi:uncharacterized membrane protein YhaH (DUF805 family)